MRGVRAALLLSLCAMYASVVSAAQGDVVSVGTTRSMNLGNWAVGDGDQVVSQVLCTVSVSNYYSFFAYWFPWFHGNPQPYAFKVTDLSMPSGYYLYLNGDDGNTGNARIQTRFQHRDTMQPVGFETLDDSVYDGHHHLGQGTNCPNGDNSEMKMTLSSIELQKAKAGQYVGYFQAAALGGLAGNAEDTDNFTMRVNISPAVQISGLQDINLGDWGGGGDKTGSTTFCVYSNNASAAYGISMSSVNQDASSNFFLVNGGGTSSLPYTLEFADSALVGTGTVVGGASLSGTGNNDAPDCGGVDNARLTVTVLATDLAGAAGFSYSDSIELVVVPM